MSGDSGDRSAAFASESVPDEYERHLVPTVFAQWAEVLLDVAVVTPGNGVLDIASGTGALARAVSRRTGSDGHVVASDVSSCLASW
jgi:ubiquinone/menaquinone biosynthesis C-methylase UbiE